VNDFNYVAIPDFCGCVLWSWNNGAVDGYGDPVPIQPKPIDQVRDRQVVIDITMLAIQFDSHGCFIRFQNPLCR